MFYMNADWVSGAFPRGSYHLMYFILIEHILQGLPIQSVSTCFSAKHLASQVGTMTLRDGGL